MKAVVASCAVALALALVGCGHKRPKEAKTSPRATPSAPESGKCAVKGFAYSVPAPGPITDGGAP
jgi:hypothetical protein